MKKAFVFFLLVSGSLAFSQQSPNPFPNNSIFNYKSESSNASKMSLNMYPFELEDFKSITNSLSKYQRKPNIPFLKPLDNMPIYELQGKFFLEIYKVDKDIDHKLKIFDFEKSKYFKRSMG